MLDPRTRGALLEALRPPPGYVVDCAVATTYSLDLLALMTAPLAFSLYDRLAARDDDRERLDSFALLHAVRQHAERLVVFCQSGCIAVPSGFRQLLVYLEDAVVQVRAPNDRGVFHPKLWIERLTPITTADPTRYRVLVLSRNLTFDRSWDTMLSLDGTLDENRTLAIGDSRPLGDFVEALPSLAVDRKALGQRRKIVDTIADELRRVRFEVPADFQRLKFWPLGHDGKRREPFDGERIERLLVVSPFLSAERLALLAEHGKKHVLVSRIDELEAMPKNVLDRYAEVQVLHDGAEEIDDEPIVDDVTAPRLGPIPPAKGLHAKLYVADDGWDAHVWTGSANASHAAFDQNVEFLVQLTGPKSKFGVDATLEGKGDTLGLRALLAPFVTPEEPTGPTAMERQLDEILRYANRAVSNGTWVARVDGVDAFDVTLALRAGKLILPSGCAVRAWPISLPVDRARVVDGPKPEVHFEACSFAALTAFFGFEITAKVGQRVQRCEFVVRAELEGAPEDRSARVLHTLLDDPIKVLRFLRMLLSSDGFEAFDMLDEPATTHEGSSSTTSSTVTSAVPLLESLVRTLEREPERLVEVERLVRELRATPGGTKMLPAEFDEVWTPLWSAYQSLAPKRKTP